MKRKRSVRKFFCMFVAVAMVVTLMPMTAFAAPAEPQETVNAVHIKGVPRPVAGAACSLDNVTVTTEPEYAVSVYDRYWYDDTAGAKATGKFIEGHVYHVNIIFELNNTNYKFKFDETSLNPQAPLIGTVTYNGEDADIAEKDMGNEMGLFTASKGIVAKRLDAVKSVSVELYKYNAIKVSWPKVAGVDGYELDCKVAGDKYYQIIDETAKTSYPIYGVKAGQKYYVRVTSYLNPFGAYGSLGYGPSKTAPGIYTLKKLSTPKVSKKSSGKVTVRWNNIAGETGYQVSKSTSKNKTGTIYTIKTTTGKSKVLNVKKKKTYYYKVRAYKTVNGKKICAPWSAVKSYKLK